MRNFRNIQPIYETDADFEAEVKALMDRTSRVASAMRTIERGWDHSGQDHGQRRGRTLAQVMADAEVEVLRYRLDNAERGEEDLF